MAVSSRTVRYLALLILDEPTAGVDIELRRSMWRFLTDINKQGKTIILTTHYLEEAEALCRHIAIINNGEVIENTAMKTILLRLQTETFILDLKSPLEQIPCVAGYRIEKIDDTTLSVDISKEQTINAVFAELSKCNIEVLSMRNKANRLEEMFVKMLGEDNKT